VPDKDQAASDSESSDRQNGITRRAALSSVGLATASLLGCTGATAASGSKSEIASKKPETFGFGGAPLVSAPTSVENLATTESEPNDRRANATAIETDTPVSGTLSTADIDWFAFHGTGSEVTIEFTRSTDTGVAIVGIYDSAGNFVNHVYAVGSGSVTVSESTTEDTHYLQVVDINDGEGEYTITVQTGSKSGNDDGTGAQTTTYGVQGYGQYGYGGIVT